MLNIDTEVRVGTSDTYVTQVSQWENGQRTDVVTFFPRNVLDDSYEEAVDAAKWFFFAAREKGVSDERILGAFRMIA